MRSRVIMLLSVLLGVGIDVVWLRPELPTPTVVLGHLPFLVAIGLGAYAAFSLLISAVLIMRDFSLVRARLRSLVSPSRQAWDKAFTGTSLTRIASRLVEFATNQDANPENQRLVRYRLGVSEARREIGRVYSNWLVRLQSVTAIAVLVAMLAFDLAQPYALAVPRSGSAGFAQLLWAEILAIALLGFFSRAAISLAAEPFLDAVAAVGFEYLDWALLRSLGSGSRGVPAPVTDLLASLLERDQKMLSEAISRLAEISELLSSVAQSGLPASVPTEPRNLEAFTSAIDRLAAAIDRAAALSLPGASNTGDQIPERPREQGDLSHDLRAILKEFD